MISSMWTNVSGMASSHKDAGGAAAENQIAASRPIRKNFDFMKKTSLLP